MRCISIHLSLMDTDSKLRFDRDGYVVIPNFLSPDVTHQLKHRVDELLDAFSLDQHPLTKFSTGETSEHVGDNYFLTSGDKVRYFLEEDAFDSNQTLVKPPRLSVNKIGHGLHEHDPMFAQVSGSAKVHQICHDTLKFRDPRCLQSMIITKQPEIGGKVPPHQDSCFLYTSPPSAIGFWFALEDCTPSNGALSFLPGSHLLHPIPDKRFVRQPNGTTGFVDTCQANTHPPPPPPPPPNEYKMETCPAGSLVLIHGSVLHKSERNTSPHSRYAYTFHVIEGAYEYDSLNWLQIKGQFSRV